MENVSGGKNGKVNDGVPQKVLEKLEWWKLWKSQQILGLVGCSSLSLRNIPSGGENVVPPAVSPARPSANRHLSHPIFSLAAAHEGGK